jgi:hypothetical protein
VLEKEYS